MNEQNLGDVLQVIEVLAPARKTATETGSAIDIQQYVGDLKVILSTSAGGGTTPTLAVKLQECATSGGTFTDISGATFTQVTDAADSTEAIVISADSAARYIKAVATIGGTSPTFDMALVAVGVKQVR
jgi:hypothetical protein